MKNLLAFLKAASAVGMLALVSPLHAQPPPLAFWSFDDGANPTSDDTGNGYDGTLFGTPTYDSADRPSQIGSGNSLSFNGTTNYIALDMSFIGNATLPELTASVWFKTTFNSGVWFNNWSFLDFDRSENFNVFVTPAGEIGFATTSSVPAPGLDLHDMFSTATGLNDGTWHHAAVVYDGSDKLIYIDGALDSVAISAHGGLPLGRGAVSRYGFIGDGSEAVGFNGSRNNILYEGKMDEVAFWNVSLSADEIQDIADGASILTLDVDVDIKPGSDPNSINLCSNGAVPVAILGSSTFDVYDVDTATLRFAEATVKVVGKKDPHTLCSYEDVNLDGFTDLVCHFITTDIAALDGDSSTATVNGTLYDVAPLFGTAIAGTDGVNIVKDTCF